MRTEKLDNGDLLMQVECVGERADIAQLRKVARSEIAAEGTFIIEMLEGFEQVPPEDVGALTSAAIISDGDNIYGYMSYQLRNVLAELAQGRAVTWTRG